MVDWRRSLLSLFFIGFAAVLVLSNISSATSLNNIRTGNLTALGADPLNPLTVIEVSDEVTLANARRFGINIGARSPYGAAQYIKNLVPNPGFESAEFGMVFLTEAGADGSRVQSDNWQTQWNNEQQALGHPQGFWNNADFEVVYGPAKWRSGTVSSFTHENDRNTFYLNPPGEPLQKEDVVFVRKSIDGYRYDTNPNNRAQPGDVRPGSPGTQSLRLTPPTNNWEPSWVQALDSYHRDQDNGGSKFLIVSGDWNFEVWAKATQPGDTLRVVFQRLGETTFFDETIPLSSEWQHIKRDFSVQPGADNLLGWSATMPRNALSFEFRINPGGGDVLVDDVVLQRAGQSNPTEFTDNFVNRLTELQPGILRNWGNQLGSTLDNQLAVEFARKTTGFNPKFRIPDNYHYSLHEFLTLARLVGAEPWYVIPPTFSRADMANLAAYLNAPAGAHAYADKRASLGQTEPWTSVFDTIHLEYGNESWGANAGADPFLGASMRGGERAGQIASDRIGIFKGSPFYADGVFNFALGGQAFYPDRQAQLEQASSNHNTIGLAPYFGKNYESFGSDEEIFYPLYAHAQQSVRNSAVTQSMQKIAESGRNTQTAVYEINLHTLTGDIWLEQRNVFLAGQAASIALPLTMMTYQRDLGINQQMAYQAVQYSTLTPSGHYARIFGMLRDLEATGRKRPTWLATELANRAVRGDMLTTIHSGANPSFGQEPVSGISEWQSVPYVQSFVWREGNTYAMALYNLHLTQGQNVQIKLPHTPGSNATLSKLEAEGLYDNNEDYQKVATGSWPLGDFRNGYELALQPHSMAVIEWTVGDEAVDQPPDANEDSLGIVGPGVINGNVLSNDRDPDGDGLWAELMQSVDNGVLAFEANGAFSYTPNPGFVGIDTFTYRARAGELASAETNVSLGVLPADAKRIFLPITLRQE